MTALMQTDNTIYDYSADFEKIIASSKIRSVDNGGGGSKSSSSSVSAQAQEKEESSSSEAPSEEKSDASSGAPSEEEMLAALENSFPQDTAYWVATVSITNQMAADVLSTVLICRKKELMGFGEIALKAASIYLAGSFVCAVFAICEAAVKHSLTIPDILVAVLFTPVFMLGASLPLLLIQTVCFWASRKAAASKKD